MRTSFVTALTACLAAGVGAVSFTNSDYGDLEVGKAFNLTWEGDGTSATIKLFAGEIKDLQEVLTVAPSATGTSFTFLPPPSLQNLTLYAFGITQSGSMNYSPQFTVAGASVLPPSSPSPLLPPSPPLASLTGSPLLPGHQGGWYPTWNNSGNAATATGTGCPTATAGVGGRGGSGTESAGLGMATIIGVMEKYQCGEEGCMETFEGAASQVGVRVGMVVAASLGIGVWLAL